MLLHEANSRLKKEITVEQLDNIHMLYCILNFLDKDDFCKIVDALGVEKLEEGADTYSRLFKAENLLKAKEHHEKKKKEVVELDARMKQLAEERKEALESVAKYEQEQENNWIKK